jgi:capsular exopolysaccharide synthesis family protein
MVIGKHFASLGLKVLLIDADLRKPSMHLKLGLPNGAGLTNYLTGGASPPEVIRSTATPNLTFISSGPIPPNASDLLGGSRMLSLISVGNEVFDLIIVDSPPVMGLADAPIIASSVAATIFVAAAGQARRGFIGSAMKRLRFARVTIIGGVITKFDAKREYGYGYGYGYSYGYGYRDEAETSEVEPKLEPEPKRDELVKTAKARKWVSKVASW